MSCMILSKPRISNREYLELMIRHRKVAIKMSETVLFSSDNDFILDYARKIKSKYRDEVVFLEKLLKSLPNIQNQSHCGCTRTPIYTSLETAYPGIFSNVKCIDADFAIVKDLDINCESKNEHGVCHNTVITLDKISDCDYVTNMFAHHKSAADLSKLLLKSTKEPKLFVIAQTVISDAPKDMFALSYLKNNLYNWKDMIPQKFYK